MTQFEKHFVTMLFEGRLAVALILALRSVALLRCAANRMAKWGGTRNPRAARECLSFVCSQLVLKEVHGDPCVLGQMINLTTPRRPEPPARPPPICRYI